MPTEGTMSQTDRSESSSAVYLGHVDGEGRVIDDAEAEKIATACAMGGLSKSESDLRRGRRLAAQFEAQHAGSAKVCGEATEKTS